MSGCAPCAAPGLVEVSEPLGEDLETPAPDVGAHLTVSFETVAARPPQEPARGSGLAALAPRPAGGGER